MNIHRHVLATWAVVVIVVAFFLAVSILASPAKAATCLGRSEMVAMLADRYDEARVARGLVQNGRMAEVFASPDGGTWTMVVTSPQGLSCVIAVGEAWASTPRPPDLGPEA